MRTVAIGGDRPGVFDGRPTPQGDPASAPTFNGELADTVERANGDTEGRQMGTGMAIDETGPLSSTPGTTDGIAGEPERENTSMRTDVDHAEGGAPDITPPPQHLLTIATPGVIARDGLPSSVKGKGRTRADGVCYQRPPNYRPAPSKYSVYLAYVCVDIRFRQSDVHELC